MFEYDRPMVERATDDFDLVLRNACRAALKKGLVSDPNDLLVVTAGLPCKWARLFVVRAFFRIILPAHILFSHRSRYTWSG